MPFTNAKSVLHQLRPSTQNDSSAIHYFDCTPNCGVDRSYIIAGGCSKRSGASSTFFLDTRFASIHASIFCLACYWHESLITIRILIFTKAYISWAWWNNSKLMLASVVACCIYFQTIVIVAYMHTYMCDIYVHIQAKLDCSRFCRRLPKQRGSESDVSTW